MQPGDVLAGLAGSPGAPIAVGIHFDGGTGSPLVLRQRDDTWKPVTVPTPGGRDIQLQDAVTEGDRTWTVGVLRNDVPKAGRIRGGRFTWVDPIDPGPTEDQLLGVTVDDAGAVWAVGKHQEADANFQPLIERYAGSGWSIVPSPRVQGSSVLSDVTVVDGEVWAVGWSVLEGGRTRPLAERWTGSAWEVVPMQGAGLLQAIISTSGGIGVAVGWSTSSTGEHPLVWRLVGTGWERVPVDAAGRLLAVAAAERIVVAVGTQLDGTGVPRSLVMRLDSGSSTVIEPVDTTGSVVEPGGDVLQAVVATPASFLAVGVRDLPDAFGSLVVAGDCSG